MPNEKCVHYWRINEENHGVCLKCGTGKQFPRDLKDSFIDYGKLKERARKASNISHSERMKRTKAREKLLDG